MADSIAWLDVDKVHPNNYNPNMMGGEKFEALKDFCMTHGADQLDPIWVRHDGVDKYEIIDGEHRWKAVKEIGWKRLRAFVIDLKEEDAKAFNVRKNRERGQIDAIKFGKIAQAEFERLTEIKNAHERDRVIAQKFGLKERVVRYYRCFVNHEAEIRNYLKAEGHGTAHIGFYKAYKILIDLKRERRNERIKTDVTHDVTESQNLEHFLTNYAEALKKNPLPKIERDDVQVAIDFFKRILKQKNVVCPHCGEKHLQWKCGHEF